MIGMDKANIVEQWVSEAERKRLESIVTEDSSVMMRNLARYGKHVILVTFEDNEIKHTDVTKQYSN